jgi:hypothetical protein
MPWTRRRRRQGPAGGRRPPCATTTTSLRSRAVGCQAGRQTTWVAATTRAGTGWSSRRVGLETNRIQLVLFGIQDRSFVPCLAAIHRILIPVMACDQAGQDDGWVWSRRLDITETDRRQLVLFGIQNRTRVPCLAAIHRILLGVGTGGVERLRS